MTAFDFLHEHWTDISVLLFLAVFFFGMRGK